MKLFNALVSELRENNWNSNRMDEEHFDGLVQSISDYPDMLKAERIVVRDIDDGYEILGGAHRYRAVKLLGFDEVPVGSLGEITDDRAKLISLILNNRGTESYDRKMDIIYSIKSVYDVSAIARKIGMDAVRLNGIVDGMASGVDQMADTATDGPGFGDVVSDGFRLTIGPTRVKTPTTPALIPVPAKDDYNVVTTPEAFAESVFGGQESIEVLKKPSGTPTLILPVKANVRKALRLGIAQGMSQIDIIDKACEIYIGE